MWSVDDLRAKLDWEGIEYLEEIDPNEVEDHELSSRIIQWQVAMAEIRRILDGEEETF